MTLRSLRPALGSSNGYVCLACRLRNPYANLQARRQQHADAQSAPLEPDAFTLGPSRGSTKSQEQKGPDASNTNKKGKNELKNTESKSFPKRNVEELETRQPSAAAQKVQRLLHEKFVAQRRKVALARQTPEDSPGWDRSESKKRTKKERKEKTKASSKPKIKAERKKSHTVEAISEPPTQPNRSQDVPPTGVGSSKALTKVVKGKKLAAKSGKAQKETTAKASTGAKLSASGSEDKTTQSSEPKTAYSKAAKLLKDYVRRGKEAIAAGGSVNQQPSSSTQEQPPKKVSTARRRRGRERRVRPKEVKKTSAASSKKGNKIRRVLAISSLLEEDKAKKAEVKVRRINCGLEGVIHKVASTSAAKAESTEEKVRGQSSVSKLPRMKALKDIQTIDARELEITALDLEQPPVPHLSYGLERVLFNPGVYHLQDPRSRVYNFDPYLQTIMPVKEFDFNALKEYITSSRDSALQVLAESYKKRYVGSSSSMTGVLAHFHFLLSQWRAINTKMLSREFPDEHIKEFTELQRVPTAVFLKWRNGSYAIDADKEFANANVLMLLGKSMEKLLTLDTQDFEKYRRSSTNKVPEEERKAPEAYHYSTMGDFIMRSQLDAYDPRLPGTGMFDLKTRAVVSVRMEASKYEEGSGYQIKTRQGAWESFEREYFDMIRSAFLKYSLQVRMGRMDGIFVAFHNTDRIFGFQYVSLAEMDATLHGQWDTNLGDQEFKFSIALLNEVLNKASRKYPNTSLRLHFETRKAQTPFMYIFAEPVTEEQMTAIQTARDAKVQELEEELYGNKKDDNDSAEGDQSWENLQANVQDAMDRDIQDPNHADGRQDLDTELIGPEEHDLEEDRLPHDHDSVEQSENSSPVLMENGGPDEDLEPDDGDTMEQGLDNGEDDAENEIDLDEPEEEEDADQEARGGSLIGKDTMVQADEELGLAEQASHDGAVAALEESSVQGSEVSDDEGHGSTVGSDETGYDEIGDPSSEIMDSSGTVTNGMGASPGDSKNRSQSDENIQEEERVLGNEVSDRDDTLLDQSVPQSSDAISSGKEVLALTLTIRNNINGNFVVRPVNLKHHEKWSVEYSLDEVADGQRAWDLYQACQIRRKKKLNDQEVRSEDDDQVDGYIRRLRQMSRQGAKWRRKQDKEDEKLPLKVLGKNLQEDKEAEE